MGRTCPSQRPRTRLKEKSSLSERAVCMFTPSTFTRAIANRASSDHNADANELLTPGIPPQETEFISPIRSGMWRACEITTSCATDCARPLVAALESSSATVSGVAEQCLSGYRCSVTIPSRGSPARNCPSIEIQREEPIAGPASVTVRGSAREMLAKSCTKSLKVHDRGRPYTPGPPGGTYQG